MKEEIRKVLLDSGAAAVGFARAGKIPDSVHREFADWVGEGCNGEMAYLQRHIPLRENTDNVLPGARTVISLAFKYQPKEWRNQHLPYLASYAYGEDYHIRLREILFPLISSFKQKYGGKWRLCIDSAPIAERFWAVRSGIGVRGLNGAVIVPGCGSFTFLAEILTTLEIVPDKPSEGFCNRCGRCIDVCPAGALKGDGKLDARRCINYLTIEKNSDFTDEEKSLLSKGSGYLYGCDRCLRVCPLNIPEEYLSQKHASEDQQDMPPESSLQSLFPSVPEVLRLDVTTLLEMDEKKFQELFSQSPLNYAGYRKLLRNTFNLNDSSSIKE
ncbi:MAG: tRNA epoxyqueuosine(34) reductase QueG [Muribaculaceae bacterium]|nr:tRNA epoxyqueuosine(34) reductase QueG [Muribaculaceae bacterium]